MSVTSPSAPRHRSPLHDGSLFQPRRPAFWVFLSILVATGSVLFGEQSFFRGISPGGLALSWGLLAIYATPVFLLVYVLDLYEREPISLVIGALLWGAVAATTLAGFANDGWGLVVARVGGPEFAARWTAALTAPFVEEILKGLGVVLIYLIAPDEIDDMMDGFVYGAVCGLGFAVVEDVFYFMGVFGGRPSGILQGFFVRVVASGLYSHVLYTGLVGMGIGYFVSRRQRRPFGRRLTVVVGLSAAAVFGHFLWNSPLLDLFPARPWAGVHWLMIPIATSVPAGALAAIVGAELVLLCPGRGRARRHNTHLSSPVDRFARSLAPDRSEPVSDQEPLGTHARSRCPDRAMRLLGRGALNTWWGLPISIEWRLIRLPPFATAW